MQKSVLKLQNEKDKVAAWNGLQYFELRPLTKAFYELVSCIKFKDFVDQFKSNPSSHKIFLNLQHLNLINIILKDGLIFRSIFNSDQIDALKQKFMDLCGQIWKEIVVLTHAFPYTDRMLGMLGYKDMHGYDHIIDQFKSVPKTQEKAWNWKEFYNQ